MTVAQKSLDAILFETQDPERTELLEAYINQEEPVRVRVVGSKEPVHAPVLGRDILVTPEGVMVTPRMAIELLYLYGRRGLYYGLDRETGHTAASALADPHLSAEEKKKIRARIQTWYLTTEDPAPEA
jgi:hypothetical protein